MNAREITAAVWRFYQRTGRKPRRVDFRSPRREEWESILGFKLPSEYLIRKEFGSYANFMEEAGLGPNIRSDIEDIEDAAMRFAISRYPNAEIVKSDRSVYDLENGSERIEIKGTVLAIRNDTGELHFSWRLHKRKMSDLVDKVLAVGFSKDLEPLIALEFSGASLKLLDGLDTLTVYGSVFFGSHSKYAPYIVWKTTLQKPIEFYARESEVRQ